VDAFRRLDAVVELAMSGGKAIMLKLEERVHEQTLHARTDNINPNSGS